ELVKKHLNVEKPDRGEIKVDVAGVNHFTFVPRASWKGRDIYPLIEKEIQAEGFFDDQSEKVAELLADNEFFKACNKIKYDFYRRFGVFGAAGDRHLVEFVPWYAIDEKTLHRWGVLLTPSAFRLGKVQPKSHLERKHKSGQIPEKLYHTGEEGVEQMCAIVGAGDLDTNVNLPNRGQLPELPPEVVVESNAQFRHGSVAPITSTPLPDAVLSLVDRVVDVQEMTVAAGMEKDFDLALQALLLDPLCSISTDAAAEMLREMLTANKEMMRGWEL
ncbi:MAG: alpha-glucosidase/alpha-galactosidase, partial [Planctomycetota bacterium]